MAEFVQNDLGKAMTLASDSTYRICTDGEEMEAFLVAVESFTVNDGHSFGAVQRNQRCNAVLATAAEAVIGTYVVAAAQKPMGVMNTLEYTGQSRHMPLVKPAPTGTVPVFKWRILSISRITAAGEAIVTIERV